jgi:DNA repair protein RadA/Sms
MGKKLLFVCQSCGYETYKWMGKCPRCAAWDTMREVEATKEVAPVRVVPRGLGESDYPDERTVLGIDELDRVLGGGLTVGSSILLGGDPGIGKTTLCFHIAATVMGLGLSVLYVSGEESLRQLASRKRRLGMAGDFPVLITSSVDDVMGAVAEKRYDLVIIDSIQSLCNPSLPMLAGTVGQIRDVSSRLIQELKRQETSHVFIGHVTKEGQIAGPKLLEHMVDTVLYFEGDKSLPYRLIRAMKNRFGSIDEVGIFQMTGSGLVGVENPSDFFVGERSEVGSGSTLFPTLTGSRPIVVEIQAVTPRTNFANPRRLCLGYDVNRLHIMLAVLEKVSGTSIYDRDVFVNITGGMRVSETAADLAVAGAILSSLKNVTLGRDTAIFGEIGLTGEVRRVIHMEMRVRECQRMGIKRIITPRGVDAPPGVEAIPLKNLRDLLDRIG